MAFRGWWNYTGAKSPRTIGFLGHPHGLTRCLRSDWVFINDRLDYVIPLGLCAFCLPFASTMAWLLTFHAIGFHMNDGLDLQHPVQPVKHPECLHVETSISRPMPGYSTTPQNTWR